MYFPNPAMLESLQKQVEYYFSPTNLANDKYLVSIMDKESYVLVSTIFSFKMVQRHTNDISLLIRAIKASKLLVLNSDESSVRAVPIVEEKKQVSTGITVILCETKMTKSEEIEKILSKHKPQELKLDSNDQWFITFSTENEASVAFEYLSSQTLNGQSLKVSFGTVPVLNVPVVTEDKPDRPLTFAEMAARAKGLKQISTPPKTSTTVKTEKKPILTKEKEKKTEKKTNGYKGKPKEKK